MSMRVLRGYVVVCEADPVPSRRVLRQFANKGGWTELDTALIFPDEKTAIRRAKGRRVNPTWRVAVFEVWFVAMIGGSKLVLGAEVWPNPNVVDRLGRLA